ncbi:MAG: GTPase Era [Thiohalomonadales bacterium]
MSDKKSNQIKRPQAFVCGYVAIIGRPNVGKSTLLNKLLQQKISITSHKPQTTRHAILGIKTTRQGQTIYVDTPGLQIKNTRAMNKVMNRAADNAAADVDVVLFLVDAAKWQPDDEYALSRIPTNVPTILLINKIDKIKDKSELLPLLQKYSAQHDFFRVIPVSARNGEGLDALEGEILSLLPEAKPLFPDDQITDRSERFLVAEIVREKLMRSLGQEIPYEVTVEIESYRIENQICHIGAIIWVSRKGQKGIIIGQGGQSLKKIGEKSRLDIERILQSKVFLQLWVKVKQGWSDDIRALNSLGYGETK